MAVDWVEALREQGEIVKRMVKNVPEALNHPDLTLDQASRIYGMVEKAAQDVDRIVELMEEDGADDAFFETAEALQDIWDHLSISAANKVRTMQGLDPIDYPADLGDDED